MWFDSPVAIAATGLITTLISFFVNAAPNQKLIRYTYIEQLRDLLPSILLSAVMAAAVYALNWVAMPLMLKLIAQLFVGAGMYIGLSVIFRVESFCYIVTTLKTKLFKKQKGVL